MADKTVDLVVYGASGFTGRRVAAEIAAVGFQGKLGLAGRSRSKLERVAASLEGLKHQPRIIIAEVSDAEGLRSMAAAARVVINTVGPFRNYGEPVYKACIAGKADYLDVSGEPEFIERMELEYGEAAAAAGIYMASAMGFDSVPGDLGVLYTVRQFQPPARCTLVESVLTIRGGPQGFQGHFPTYESAVYGFASAGELRALRKKAEAQRGKVDLKVPGPRPPRQAGAAFDARVNAWTFPFMGADASVIRRSMQRLVPAGVPPANVAITFTLPSRYYSVLFQLYGAVFAYLAARPWGRSLLLRFPSLFSNGMFTPEGPSEQQIRDATFMFTNIAHGYSKGAPESPGEPPDMEMFTRVSGPEPGYIACSIFVVQAALMLLEERDKLGVSPGVHTPASLLAQRLDDYIGRVRARGITFERIDAPRVQ